MRYNYVMEKLGQAIRNLATGQGDVRSRLHRAYTSFHPLQVNDFPPEFQKDWEWILNELNRKGPVYNHKDEPFIGSVQNTMNNIRNSTGEKIAERIIKLYRQLEDYNPKK